jgi:hypothetical protein
MADETQQQPEVTPASAAAPPEAAPAKKEKAPAVEDKALPDFMAQDCLPALQKSLGDKGVAGLDLKFAKQKVAVKGYEAAPECWQVVAQWQVEKQPRQFNIYFFDENLQGARGFSYSIGNVKPSTMESFRIDERKMSLDLLVSGVLQRLNSQKWLARN